jgi:molybdenum cofactor cytidylyltransferase
MAIQKRNIAILILAAGASSRMGRPKQLLPWKNTTLLGNAIRNAKKSIAKDTFVVFGANSALIRKKIQEKNIVFIDNDLWRSGLGSSIARGVGFIKTKELQYDGLLITLADQPLINSDYINLIIESFYKEGKGIVATAYINRVGVPALFSSIYFESLIILDEDYGAKQFLEKNKNDIFKLDAGDKVLDVDTVKDYEELKNI